MSDYDLRLPGNEIISSQVSQVVASIENQIVTGNFKQD